MSRVILQPAGGDPFITEQRVLYSLELLTSLPAAGRGRPWKATGI
jgi:hypothetical protein